MKLNTILLIVAYLVAVVSLFGLICEDPNTPPQPFVADTTVEMYENLYVTQAAEIASLKLKNDSLAMAAEQFQAQVRSYAKLVAYYQTHKDTIFTTDTVMVDTTTKDTIHMRSFDKWVVPGELRFRGRFQIQEPYNLYVDGFYLKLNPEIVLAQDRNQVWTALVDTHSGYLKVSDIDLKVIPRPRATIDLKPKIFVWGAFGHPSNELGMTARIRILDIHPFALVSTERIQAGFDLQIYGKKE